MKTLEDERYVVIKAYKCTVSEIWRDFFVLYSIIIIIIARSTSYPLYRVYDSLDPRPQPGSGLGSRLRTRTQSLFKNLLWYLLARTATDRDVARCQQTRLNTLQQALL